MQLAIDLTERGLVPDPLIRYGIRRLLRQRLQQLAADGIAAKERLFEAMRQGPIAVHTDEANEQHYEVPPPFFELVLGRHLKYSACYYEDGAQSLDEAEAAMLKLSCQRAGLQDGMEILELGCGWGSLTLWMAQNYPGCRITAVSNSALQRRFIEARCQALGIDNVAVLTADMNAFEAPGTYDRVMSIEMFEHMRNYEDLLARVSGWLRPEGRAFVHVFCHREQPYIFGDEGAGNWMGRYFFTGGLMPSEDLFGRFGRHLAVEAQWAVNGANYARTAEDWLANLDRRRQQILPILEECYGTAQAPLWLRRWRLFFLACAELFGYAGGEEWKVCHYLLRRV